MHYVLNIEILEKDSYISFVLFSGENTMYIALHALSVPLNLNDASGQCKKGMLILIIRTRRKAHSDRTCHQSLK